MDVLHHLAFGFSVALTPTNFAYCLIGALLGTLVGVIPGLGPVTTIAMLLPITFKIPATASLIMLAGIYYGAHHAGSTTAIMLNMPGEPTSVVICLDGHPMARQGRAGIALCTSALASFFAGCVSVMLIAWFSPVLVNVAMVFGPAEYTSIILMALVAIAVLSNGELLMTLAAAFFGLLLGTVGTDVTSGVTRFAFGLPGLYDGLSFVAVAVGLFAFAEVMTNMGEAARSAGERPPIRGLIPSRADVSAAWRPVLRGTAIGAGLGILPGTGPLLSSFASYAMEKQISRQPGRFGNGAIEGVAGPEAANNAAALTHFIPMLTLGIPAGSAMALMLGALIIQGITPGPQVMTEHPDLFWGLVASMWIGNLMLLVLNLPLIGIWVRLLSIPYRLIYPAVLIFCCIGVYSVNNSTSDVLVAAVFGLIGVFLKRIGCTPAPVLLGLILGQLLEENFRRSLLMSGGDMSVFVTHPISLGFLLIAIALPVWIWLRGRRGPASGATRAEFLH